MTSAPVVFFDIAGPDAAKLKSFYSENFGWAIDDANGITTPGLKGTIRQDPPEIVIYLSVSDIDAALTKIVAAGGAVVLPRTMVSKVVIFALFRDPAGNRMGLVETGKQGAQLPRRANAGAAKLSTAPEPIEGRLSRQGGGKLKRLCPGSVRSRSSRRV